MSLIFCRSLSPVGRSAAAPPTLSSLWCGLSEVNWLDSTFYSSYFSSVHDTMACYSISPLQFTHFRPCFVNGQGEETRDGAEGMGAVGQGGRRAGGMRKRERRSGEKSNKK